MNCDRIAVWYRWLEYLTFGRALERRRREYLDEAATARSVLILGDGDGRFTAEFVNRNGTAIVDSVDLSPRMLALARKRTLDARYLQLWQGDALAIELPRKYDLIVSHFFLDCFVDRDLASLVARISNAACPRARWIVSEFCLPTGGIRRRAASLWIKTMYWFFWIATGLEVSRLPDYSTVFALHGFRRVRHVAAAGGLLVSELFERVP
jgi:ubiquinone/menaquinone biosynthesis C-methylase UbiE